jgi:hypothetical protein
MGVTAWLGLICFLLFEISFSMYKKEEDAFKSPEFSGNHTAFTKASSPATTEQSYRSPPPKPPPTYLPSTIRRQPPGVSLSIPLPTTLLRRLQSQYPPTEYRRKFSPPLPYTRSPSGSPSLLRSFSASREESDTD